MYHLSHLFPTISESPEAKQSALGWLYWGFHLLLLPGLSVILSLEGSTVVSAFLFWIIDLGVTFLIFHRFLRDSLSNFRIYRSECLTALWQGLAVFAVLILPVYLIDGQDGQIGCIIGGPFGFQDLMTLSRYVYFDPVSENLLKLASTSLICSEILSVPMLILASPVVVGCLYYAIGFAPRADRQPWRGYLAVALILAVNTGMNYLSGGLEIHACLIRYLCQLPFHMCACWVYQRSNTIWGPILFHAIVNLISCVIFIGALSVSFLGWIGM